VRLILKAAGALGVIAVFVAGVVTARARATAAPNSAPPKLESERDKLSYGMGVAMARTFQRQGADIDVDVVARGLRDAIQGKKLLVAEEELRAALGGLQGDLKQKYARARSAADANRKEAEAFLASNARKDGVVTLPSGLQYRIIKAGHGKKPTDADDVQCHYRGALVDGTEFDSSYERGRPATFKLASVIPGLREALRLMPVGSRWQLVVPPQLAYGERGVRGEKGTPGKIGPNATLLFDLDLLAINAGEQTTAVASPDHSEE
jgi:FKBP-type peptidyl-prolyl cis-trans isomerase